MLQEITLKGVASYSEQAPVKISNLKKVNIFYGLNGSGKTTLSRFLQQIENPTPDFTKCSGVWQNGHKCQILVYNIDFIRKNFLEIHDSRGLQGLFVGVENKEILEKLEQDREALSAAKEQKKSIDASIDLIDQNIRSEREKLKKSIWPCKKKYEDKNEIYKKFIKAADTQEKFLEKVLKTEKLNFTLENVDQLFQEQEREINEILSFSIEETDLDKLNNISLFDALAGKAFEKNQLLQEAIVNSQDGYIANILKNLSDDHRTWVEKGVNYVSHDTETCPFCTQSLGDDLRLQIINLFDASYQEKKHLLLQMKNEYGSFTRNCEQRFSEIQDIKNSEIQNSVQSLKSIFDKNKLLIDQKNEDPRKIITLKPHSDIFEKINEAVSQENSRRKDLRQKISNREEWLADSNKKFWSLVRIKCDNEITEYERIKSSKESEKSSLSQQLNSTTESIKAYTSQIEENIRKTRNIESAAANINKRLQWLGIFSFQLEKRDENSYHIVRKEKSCGKFESLSEGEKTLISFLYFIELCNENEKIHTDKFIVLDDPISSLSFHMIFEISCLIKREFLENTGKKRKYKQIFILTHHLYFLHEIFRNIKIANLDGHHQIFRVTKNEFSQIKKIDGGDEILNHYQSYWKIVREADNGQRNSEIVLANAMRNIIEHFFGFVLQKKVNSELFDKLRQSHGRDFLPFERYINNFSHSDSINIVDTRDINIVNFLKFFRDVFVETDFIDHYNAMMGIEEPELVDEIAA